ncbi:MAG TPA: Flp pilus assembly protein CpaB [Candidatus Baltobacteraceae bacterium]|nr:Flp pilus assembly protein CpaB [Candidatus Baltobacteraceae bacterium]
MNTRRTTLFVALGLALVAGWLTLTYLSNLQRQTNANTRPVTVLVAAQEIPARVPITAAMLGTVQRPANAIDPNIVQVQDAKQVIGTLSLITIPAGSSITASMVGRPSDVGLTVRLKPGMRAVSVSIDKVKGISGLIQPGDRVDVIAQPPKGGPAPPPAATILRGVRILSIGEALEVTSATPSPQEQQATTVTLEVTPKQANLLVMADINTTLRLALRSPKEPVASLPTEALHFDQGASAAGTTHDGAPSDALATAALLKSFSTSNMPAPPAGSFSQHPAAESNGSGSGSGVSVIDGDHYAGSQQQ